MSLFRKLHWRVGLHYKTPEATCISKSMTMSKPSLQALDCSAVARLASKVTFTQVFFNQREKRSLFTSPCFGLTTQPLTQRPLKPSSTKKQFPATNSLRWSSRFQRTNRLNSNMWCYTLLELLWEKQQEPCAPMLPMFNAKISAWFCRRKTSEHTKAGSDL